MSQAGGPGSRQSMLCKAIVPFLLQAYKEGTLDSLGPPPGGGGGLFLSASVVPHTAGLDSGVAKCS